MAYRRALILFFFLAASALAGCNSKHSASVPPKPAYPITSGDTYSFTGTLTQTITRPPAPNTTASPSTFTTAQQVTQNVTVSTNKTYNNVTTAFDLNTVETDASPLQSIKTTTDNYEAFNSSNTSLLQLGYTSTDSNGVTRSVVYGSKNQTLDQLPEVANASWTNSAAVTTTENDPDGETQTLTVADNGSYTIAQTFPDGSSANGQENGDGSGTYSYPLLGPSGNSTVNVGAPASSNIVISLKYGAAAVNAGLTDSTFKFPIWYPTPLVLASETDTNKGSTTVPSACGVGTRFAGSANAIVRNITRVDTLFGQVQTQTITSYVQAGRGPVCMQLHDDTKWYYDYSGQTALQTSGTNVSATTFGSTLIEEVVTDETLGLQSASIAGQQSIGGAFVLGGPDRAHFESVVAAAVHDHQLRFFHRKGTN